MSDRQPRQVQYKLGDVDADGNWQLGSPAPAFATDDTTQAVTGYKRRAPTTAAPPFSTSNLQAAARHNAAKEKKKTARARRRNGRRARPNGPHAVAVAVAVAVTRDQVAKTSDVH